MVQTKGSVLIVDDDDLNCDILQELVEEEGYEHITAKDGQQAWDVLKTEYEKIHFILLDRMMPVMDGMGLMRKINSYALYSGIPVIMQTAADQAEDLISGVETGEVFYYLKKPFDHEILRDILALTEVEYQKRNPS